MMLDDSVFLPPNGGVSWHAMFWHIFVLSCWLLLGVQWNNSPGGKSKYSL